MNVGPSDHEALEAYVIGALDATERARFEVHLSGCEPCRNERASFATVVASLDSLATPEPPPTPRLPARARDVRRLVAFASLATAGIAIVAGVAVPQYEREATSERAYAEIARMLATDPQEVTLIGSDGITGRAIVGEARHASGFVVRGLPPPPAGFVYRVWVRDSTHRRTPGILDHTAEGLDVLVTPGDALARASSIRVMLESESLEAADRLPRKVMLGAEIG